MYPFVCLFDGVYRHFQQYFNFIFAVGTRMHSILIKKKYLTIPKNVVICFQSSAIRYHFSRFRSITIKYRKQCSFHTANAGWLTNGKTVNFDIFFSAPSVLFRRIAVQFNNPRFR